MTSLICRGGAKPGGLTSDSLDYLASYYSVKIWVCKMNDKKKIAILDDYQDIAIKMENWPLIPGNTEIKVFNDHITELEKLVERLYPYNVLCIMRERTPMTAELIDRLPNLKLIAST